MIFLGVGIIIGLIIYAILQKSKNKLNNEIKDNLNSELERFKADKSIIEKQLTENLIQTERLRTQLEEFTKIKAANQEYQKTISELQNEKAKLEANNQDLKNNLEKSKLDNDLLNKTIEDLRKAMDNHVLEIRKLSSLNSELNMRIEKDNQSYEEKLELLNNSEKKLKESFENLANQILDAKTKTFNDKQNEQLDQVLKPLKEQLDSFRNRVETVHTENKSGQELLKQTIDDMKKINLQISNDAQNLTNALKHDTKAQGSWGELVLESILENSGLREGYEFSTQESFKNEEGKIQRPDVIVKLPNQKHVIIDSKMSLTAYERYVNESNEVEKEKELSEHILSVRKHIKELAEKHYENLHKANSLDFVLLFIPIESAFLTAIEKDKQLFSDAYDKMIVMVCPSTLMTTLRTIHSLWNYEYRNQNVYRIADEAGKMYDKFVGFVNDLELVGKGIKTLNKSYEDAYSKLSRGSGNLVSKAENLRKLGAKNKKKLDNILLDNSLLDNITESNEIEGENDNLSDEIS